MFKKNGWKLIHAVERQWVQDNSGIYTVIHYTPDNQVRLDVMDTLDNPCVSLLSKNAAGVYKAFADWLVAMGVGCSCEHLLYIGKELARAEMLKQAYQQE